MAHEIYLSRESSLKKAEREKSITGRPKKERGPDHFKYSGNKVKSDKGERSRGLWRSKNL